MKQKLTDPKNKITKSFAESRFTYIAICLVLLSVSCAVNEFLVIMIARFLIIPTIFVGMIKTKKTLQLSMWIVSYLVIFFGLLNGFAYIKDIPCYFNGETEYLETASIALTSEESLYYNVNKLFCKWVKVEDNSLRVALPTEIKLEDITAVRWLPNSKQVTKFEINNDIPQEYKVSISNNLQELEKKGTITASQKIRYTTFISEYTTIATNLQQKQNIKIAETKYSVEALSQILNNLQFIDRLEDAMAASQIYILFEGVIPFQIEYYKQAETLIDETLAMKILSSNGMILPNVIYLESFGYQYNPRQAIDSVIKDLNYGNTSSAIKKMDFIYSAMLPINITDNGALLAQVCYNQYGYKKPWVYAPAMGIALEATALLYEETKFEKYIDYGKRIMNGYDVPPEQGGFVQKNANGKEKILTYSFLQDTVILDGSLSALKGIRKWCEIMNDYQCWDRYQTLSKSTLDELEKFDYIQSKFPKDASWSLSYIGEKIENYDNISSVSIHRLHMIQLEELVTDPKNISIFDLDKSRKILENWTRGYEYNKQLATQNGNS